MRKGGHRTEKGAHSGHDHGQALVAGCRGRMGRKIARHSGVRFEKRRCDYCKKVGHLKRDYPQRKEEARKGSPHEHDLEERNNGCGLMGKVTLLTSVDRTKASRDFAAMENELPAPILPAESPRGSVMMATKNSGNGDGELFLLDSSASDHMVSEFSWLWNAQDTPSRNIVLGDVPLLSATHRGKMRVITRVRSNGAYRRTVTLADVLFVRGLKSNLLSFSALCKVNFRVKIGLYSCVAMKNGVIQLQGGNSSSKTPKRQ